MSTTAAAQQWKALLLLFLSVGATAMPDYDLRGTQQRKLSQFRPVFTFPYTRCGDFSSSSQPYLLEGPNVTMDASQTATFEFTIRYKGPSETKEPCYAELESSLHKIMLHMYSECTEAVKVPRYVAINGQRRTFYLYENPPGTTLSITHLGLNATTANGAKLTIKAAYPCNDAPYFFIPSDVKNTTFEVIFTESSSHRCCGRQPQPKPATL